MIHRGNLYEMMGYGDAGVGGPGSMFTAVDNAGRPMSSDTSHADHIARGTTRPDEPGIGEPLSGPPAQTFGAEVESAAEGAMHDAGVPAQTPSGGQVIAHEEGDPPALAIVAPSGHKSGATTPILVTVAALIATKALKWW